MPFVLRHYIGRGSSLLHWETAWPTGRPLRSKEDSGSAHAAPIIIHSYMLWRRCISASDDSLKSNLISSGDRIHIALHPTDRESLVAHLNILIKKKVTQTSQGEFEWITFLENVITSIVHPARIAHIVWYCAESGRKDAIIFWGKVGKDVSSKYFY